MQPAAGALEREVEVALGVQLIQRHLGIDVQRHAAVVALVDQGDETPYRIVVARQCRQLPVAGVDALGAVLGTPGNAPSRGGPPRRGTSLRKIAVCPWHSSMKSVAASGCSHSSLKRHHSSAGLWPSVAMQRCVSCSGPCATSCPALKRAKASASACGCRTQ